MGRRLVGAAAVAALVGAASWAGTQAVDSSGSTVSRSVMIRALGATDAADTARFEMQVAIGAEGVDFALDAEGAMALDGTRGSFTMSIPLVGSLEMRILDQVVYFRFPEALGGVLPTGKSWVRLDLASSLALSPEQRSLFDQLQAQSAQQSPAQTLDSLRRISGDIEEVGRETLRGADTTHYRFTLDFGELLDELEAQLGSGLSDVLEGGDAGVAEELIRRLGAVPADVWIDDADRVVRMDYELDLGAFGDLGVPGASGTMRLTMELFDFGVPVQVEAPLAEETTDFSLLDLTAA